MLIRGRVVPLHGQVRARRSPRQEAVCKVIAFIRRNQSVSNSIVISEACTRYKVSALGGHITAFDGTANLYSATRLPNDEFQFTLDIAFDGFGGHSALHLGRTAV